jgi:hypothetical protein
LFSSALTRLVSGVDCTIAYLNANNRALSIATRLSEGLEPSLLEEEIHSLRRIGPPPTQWRILDHCAAVGRLYALWEQFCEGILSDWIAFRTQGCIFNDLPEKIRISYAEGIVLVLGSLSRLQFQHISEVSLIKEYNTALSGGTGYLLSPECLTYHKNNLRWPEVVDMFSRCGIEDLEQWVARHPTLETHFQSQRKLVELSSAKLTSLVQYRNDAAHGLVEVTEILGAEELRDTAEFVVALATIMEELLSKHALDNMLGRGTANGLGKISETYSDNVTVCIIEGAKLAVGDDVYLLGDRVCWRRKVRSLHLDGNDAQTVTIAKPAEVGVKFDGKTPKRANVIRIAAL